MTLGCGYPQGPFQLLDAAGPADVLAGLRAMYLAYGTPAQHRSRLAELVDLPAPE